MPGPAGGSGRGIEGRGTPAVGRRRPMPGPVGGTGRGLEGRGVRPAPGSRMLPRSPAVVTQFAGSQGGRGVRPFPLGGHGPLRGMPAASSTTALSSIPSMAPNPSLIGQLGQLQGGYAGAVGDSIRATQAQTRDAQRPMRQRQLATARATADSRRAGPRPSSGIPDRPAPVGGGTTLDGPVGRAGGEIQQALKRSRGRGLLIGAGAAVVAGLAYSGRRGEGSSGGRTGMARY
jgi:hypothetical protein